MALSSQDWITAQTNDPNLKFVMDCLIEGRIPNEEETESRGIDYRFTSNWDKYTFVDEVLHKTVTLKDESVKLLCLPKALQGDAFRAYHDDLGHQGRERTSSLIKRRFFSWTGAVCQVESTALWSMYQKKDCPNKSSRTCHYNIIGTHGTHLH